MPEHDIVDLINSYEKEISIMKKSFYRIIWGMRGGITSDDLYNVLSFEDRRLMEEIIEENIEISKKNQMPFI